MNCKISVANGPPSSPSVSPSITLFCQIVLVLIAVLTAGVLTPQSAAAQTFETLYSMHPNFTGTYFPTTGPLVEIDSRLYGTASSPHASNGAIYVVPEDGSGVVTVGVPTGGGFPVQGATSGLTTLGSSLYGFTQGQGATPPGVIFSLNQDAGFHVLHTYTTGNAGVTLTPINSLLYGATGFSDVAHTPAYDGEVFVMNPDGTNYHVIHSFGFPAGAPTGALIQSGSTLYGYTGGLTGEVYAMGLDGSNFQVLHQFQTSGQGYTPSGLTLVGSVLYGTTFQGGSNNLDGTIFSVNVDGSNFQVLHSFSGPDGTNPNGGLTQVGDMLYGTAQNTDGLFGGTNGGTIFAINLDGSGFHVVHEFDGNNEMPGALIADGLTLYGVTRNGGDYGFGSVYSFTVPEPASGVLSVLGVTAACALARRRRRP